MIRDAVKPKTDRHIVLHLNITIDFLQWTNMNGNMLACAVQLTTV